MILWRAGLRNQEALSLGEADLDQRRGSLLVRHGKGVLRREVGMDAWSWQQLQPWLDTRLELPVGGHAPRGARSRSQPARCWGDVAGLRCAS